MITRKIFLQISSLGVASILAPNFLFSKTSSTNLPEDVATLLKQARKYRRQGRYAQAKSTYQQILTIDLTEVRAYNGLRKILLRQKHKELEVIQLYQQALTNIPNNFRFKRALSGEYLRAAIGNKKILPQLNLNTPRPLTLVKQQLEGLLLERPNDKNLQRQVAKVNKYLALNVDNTYSHQNKPLKQYRKENKKAYKNRFAQLNSVQTTQRLTDLTALPVNDDRAIHIREMYQVNIKALRTEKNYEAALDQSERFLTSINISDPYFIKQFRDLAKQLHQYDRLIDFESQNHLTKNTFWSCISLFDAYVRKAENLGGTGTTTMDTLLQFAANKYNNPMQRFEVATRKIKLNLLNGELQTAKDLLITLCMEKMNVSDAHSIDRVNILIAKYWKKAGINDYKKIIAISKMPNDYIQAEDELLHFASLMNINRSKEKPTHLEQLQSRISNL